MNPMTLSLRSALLVVLAVPTFVACTSDASDQEPAPTIATIDASGMREVRVIDTLLPDVNEAVGTAAPLLSSTLSTKLMATVSAVHVQVGDVVRPGQLLVTLDVRDIDARAVQASGNLLGAEAMLAEAELNAVRMRALFADSAAPRAQLDAAEAALSRAKAGVAGARGGVAEAAANRDYGAVRAPFAGVITQRMVDPGAFAAPGAPLVVVQQSGTLRVTALVPPTTALDVRRGTSIAVSIEGVDATGTVEGVVASPSGGLFSVNVLVRNPDGMLPPGGSATLLLPGAERSVRLIPQTAIVREGDLTGVRIRTDGGVERRWVRLGRARGELVEVLSGVNAGDVVLVPDSAALAAVQS